VLAVVRHDVGPVGADGVHPGAAVDVVTPAVAGADAIVTAIALDVVAAAAAAEVVRAGAADHVVAAAFPTLGVPTRAALEHVMPGAAVELVVAAAAREPVVALVAAELIVALVAFELVIAAPAVEVVVAVRPADVVVGLGPRLVVGRLGRAVAAVVVAGLATGAGCRSARRGVLVVAAAAAVIGAHDGAPEDPDQRGAQEEERELSHVHETHVRGQHHGSWTYDVCMCRNIRPLHNFEPPASEAEVRDAALQYVRKISGSTKPSKANEAAFARAVEEVAEATSRLLADLVTTAPPKDREVEAEKARARAAQRYAA